MKYSITTGAEKIRKGDTVYLAGDGKAYGASNLKDLAKTGHIAVGKAQRDIPADSSAIAGSAGEENVDVLIQGAA